LTLNYWMITRYCQQQLLEALNAMPVVALLGPRQVGKTTLALTIAQLVQKESIYLDLESDADSNKLQDPEAYIKRHPGKLLILDEVQRKPDLFRILRGIVDERKRNGERAGHFLLLGSASRDLLQHSSETLAGRIRYLELTPFSSFELQLTQKANYNLEYRWLTGGYPDSYLSNNLKNSWDWRRDFIATYMDRDLPNMGVNIPSAQLNRFWKMLAHYSGQQINYSELGRSMELSHTTIKNYLDVLTDFFMIRQLRPWSGNIKKRLVKSPKIYVRDSGLLHNLLNIFSLDDLLAHPAVGGSWEGFVIENILNQITSRWQYSYYRSATQNEIDLILETPDSEIWTIEIKRNSAPRLGRGFYEACNDVGATHRWIINASVDRYPLSEDIEVIGLQEFLELIESKN